MNIGEGLKKARKSVSMKQSSLAILSGYSQTYLSQIEKGHKEPTFEALRKITNALEVPLYMIFAYSLEEEEKMALGLKVIDMILKIGSNK